jgi:hypothetical protein
VSGLRQILPAPNHCSRDRLAGIIQVLGEFQFEWFFDLFGFMRYRIGRAILHIINGTYAVILGKARGQAVAGSSAGGFMLAVGVGLIVSGIANFLTPCCCGARSNTSAGGTSNSSDNPNNNGWGPGGGFEMGVAQREREPKPASAQLQPHQSQSAGSTGDSALAVRPPQSAQANPAFDDPNKPSWMQ